MTKKGSLFPVLFFLSCTLYRIPGGVKFYPEETLRGVAQEIEQVLQDSLLLPAHVGIKVVSLSSGQVLYEKNGEKLFLPASNVKLLSSAAALSLLGPEFRFETHIYQDTLKDLYIKGFGDPLLESEDLYRIAEQIKSKDVKKVRNILADDSYFDTLRLGKGWMWEERVYGFSARIGALSLNKNTMEIRVKPGEKVGDPLFLMTIPKTEFVRLRNQGVTAPPSSPESLQLERLYEGGNGISLYGKLPLGSPEKIYSFSLEDPELYTATVFKEISQRVGIEVQGEVRRGVVPSGLAPLYIHYSPPLSEVVREMNKASVNFIAEQVLKALGAKLLGPPGTAKKGEEVLGMFLHAIGIDTLSYRVADGSGLSRYNLLSASHIVHLLIHMIKDSKIAPEYLSSLPIGGVDGTLKGRMQDTLLQRHVRAKTGTLLGISSLSGYLFTKGGDTLVFAILMNHFLGKPQKARDLQDEILKTLVRLK